MTSETGAGVGGPQLASICMITTAQIFTPMMSFKVRPLLMLYPRLYRCLNGAIQRQSTLKVISLIKWDYNNENEVICNRGTIGGEYIIGAK